MNGSLLMVEQVLKTPFTHDLQVISPDEMHVEFGTWSCIAGVHTSRVTGPLPGYHNLSSLLAIIGKQV